MSSLDPPQILELAQLLPIIPLGARLVQHPHALLELEPDGLVRDEELLRRELLPHDGDVGSVRCLEGAEDVEEEGVDEVDDLVVVRLKGHLKIETHELGHVTVSVGVLGSEDWKR
jgi:hypothetical protein